MKTSHTGGVSRVGGAPLQPDIIQFHEQNLGIQIQRIDPQIQDTAIAQARSFWAPQFSTTITKNSNQQPVINIFSGTQPSVTTGQFFSGLTLAEQLPWGANYTANWNNSR